MNFADLQALITSPWAFFLLGLGLFCLALGVVLRIACGASSGLSTTATTCLAIVFIYLVSFLVDGSQLLPSAFNGSFSNMLPLVPVLFQFPDAVIAPGQSFAPLFPELMQLFLLAFLVDNLEKVLATVIRSRNFFVWLLRSCLITVLGLAANALIDYALLHLVPGFLLSWLPALLLILIGILSILALVGQILRHVAFFANPILGVVVSFFTVNPVGKAFVNAFLTIVVFLLAAAVLEMIGLLGQLALAGGFLVGCLMAMLFILLLWYITYLLVRKKK